MAVVPLNHSNAGTHLYRKRVFIRAIVVQCKRSIGVPKAINRPVLTQCAGT